MPQPGSSRRPLRVALIFGLLFAAPALVLGACGDSSDTGSTGAAASGGDPCLGGVLVGDVCQAKCDPTKCLEGNVCAGNACKLVCDSISDCYPDGSQDCVSGTEDDTGAAVQVCEFNGKSPGVGLKCPFGSECGDPAVYNLHACPDGTRCGPALCGGGACTLDDAACAGVDGCAIGKCPDDSPCTVQTCAANECKPMDCLNNGEADADAYCTVVDCTTDADCPGAYYCGIVRSKQQICGTDKGTETPCLDPSDFTKDGATFQEGPVSLLRNMCLKRSSCQTCETDIDCSAIAGQKCADVAGTKVCTRICGDDDDCTNESACDTATSTCVPIAGSCEGTGEFCDPCQDDLDCGPGTGTVSCETFDNGNGCFDTGFPFTCTSDSDCPKSPGGQNGYCLDEAVGVDSTSSVYHRCYVPFDGNFFGCY